MQLLATLALLAPLSAAIALPAPAQPTGLATTGNLTVDRIDPSRYYVEGTEVSLSFDGMQPTATENMTFPP